MNIKILSCQIIGLAAAGSAGPVPTPVHHSVSPVHPTNVAASKYLFDHHNVCFHALAIAVIFGIARSVRLFVRPSLCPTAQLPRL